MVYPMAIAIDFGSLKDVGRRPKGLVITLAIHWVIKPFTMAALGIRFFNHLFAGLIDPAKAPQYIASLILLPRHRLRRNCDEANVAFRWPSV